VNLRSTPLHPAQHNFKAFQSGEPELDRWLLDHAAGSDARRITRTFVKTERDTGNVIGYYSLMAHELIREELPKSVGRGSPVRIPAVLLARLAVATGEQGKGLGASLLGDAMQRAARAGEQVGARFVVVDALHEPAAQFYEHFGFKRIPNDLRLVQKMSSIIAALELA